jgi:hypothetical protein
MTVMRDIRFLVGNPGSRAALKASRPAVSAS